LDVTIVCKIHHKEIIGHDVGYQPNSLLGSQWVFCGILSNKPKIIQFERDLSYANHSLTYAKIEINVKIRWDVVQDETLKTNIFIRMRVENELW
jgi:hypothetical protein